MHYDPEISPNAAAWLELDEEERIQSIEAWHRKARIDLPTVRAHAMFHSIVENQLAEGLDPVVRAIARLVGQGLTRHEAVHAVASVVSGNFYEAMKTQKNDTPEKARARYIADVERLTAKRWLRKFGM